MALTMAYIATVRGRPPGFSFGNSSAISSHCSHVKLLGYALVIRSQGAGIYKFQLKPCELSYNTFSLLKHPLSNKDNKQWIGLAIDVSTKEIVGVYIGERDQAGAQGLWDSLPPVYRQCALSYTDFCPFLWNSFSSKKTQGSRKGDWYDKL
jgi:hypothetical protein